MIDINLDLSQVVTHVPDAASAVVRELLTPIPGLPDEYLLILDNSAGEKWQMCPTMARFYLVEGREAHARNAALVFGGVVHVGLESLLRSQDDVALCASMLKYWGENPSPPDTYRTLNNAVEVIKHYRTRATLPDYGWVIQSDDSGLIIERPFELPLGVLEVNATIKLPTWDSPRHVRRVHVAWAGRIDVVAHTNGRHRVVDHKTTKIAGDQFIQDFQLSSQTRGYVWAAQQLWPDLDITGFCLNAIHLKEPAAGKGLMERGPRGGEPALNFFRAYFDYEAESLEEWATDALTICGDFVHALVRDYFSMHTKQCFNKYGKCQYHDVCTITNKAVRLSLLRSDAYKQVTWNPTNDR